MFAAAHVNYNGNNNNNNVFFFFIYKLLLSLYISRVRAPAACWYIGKKCAITQHGGQYYE